MVHLMSWPFSGGSHAVNVCWGLFKKPLNGLTDAIFLPVKDNNTLYTFVKYHSIFSNVGVNKPVLSRHCAVYKHLKVSQDQLVSKWTNWHHAFGLKKIQKILFRFHFSTLLLLKKHHVSQLIIPGWDNLVWSGKQVKWSHSVAVWFLFAAVNPCGSGGLGVCWSERLARGHWLFWQSCYIERATIWEREMFWSCIKSKVSLNTSDSVEF